MAGKKPAPEALRRARRPKAKAKAPKSDRPESVSVKAKPKSKKAKAPARPKPRKKRRASKTRKDILRSTKPGKRESRKKKDRFYLEELLAPFLHRKRTKRKASKRTAGAV